jgi:hypothetical protein
MASELRKLPKLPKGLNELIDFFLEGGGGRLTMSKSVSV